MKKYVLVCAMCMFVLPALGAGRSLIGGTMNSVDNDGRMATLSNNRLHPSVKITHGAAVVVNDNGGVSVADDDPQPADAHALELAAKKKACIDNNVGIGNTFVWASYKSDTTNYATMIEDTENPDNNVCFVNVGLQSKDERVNISDIQPRYFKMGDTIVCGSWADEAVLEKRILDGKKTARILSTVGASVAGVGLGFGIMEGFGNKLLAKGERLNKVDDNWKDNGGTFNTARLTSDSIAGVVLGTVGGVVTGVVVKKAQIKKGFEDISCVVNGQIIGNYGDELSININ